MAETCLDAQQHQQQQPVEQYDNNEDREAEEELSEDSHNLSVAATSSSSIETAITVIAPRKPVQAQRSIPLPTAPLNLNKKDKGEGAGAGGGGGMKNNGRNRVPPPIATEDDLSNNITSGSTMKNAVDLPPSSDQFAALLALGVAQQEMVNAQVVTKHSPRLGQGQGQGQEQGQHWDDSGIFPSSNSSLLPSPHCNPTTAPSPNTSGSIISTDMLPPIGGGASSSSSSSLDKPLPEPTVVPQQDIIHSNSISSSAVPASDSYSTSPSSSSITTTTALPLTRPSHASRSNTSSSNTSTSTIGSTTITSSAMAQPASTYASPAVTTSSGSSSGSSKMAAFAARVGNSSALQRFQRSQQQGATKDRLHNGTSYISYPTPTTTSNQNASSIGLSGIAEVPSTSTSNGASSPSSSSMHAPLYTPTSNSDNGHHTNNHQGTSSGKGFFKDKGSSFVSGAAARFKNASRGSGSNSKGNDARPGTAGSMASTSISVAHGGRNSGGGLPSPSSHSSTTYLPSISASPPTSLSYELQSKSSTSPTITTTSDLPKSSSLRSLGGFSLNALRSATSSLTSSSSSSSAASSSSSNLRKLATRGGQQSHSQSHQIESNPMSTSPPMNEIGTMGSRPSAAHRLASFSSSSSLFGSTLGLGLGHPRSSSFHSTNSNNHGNSNSRYFTSPSGSGSSSSPLASVNGGLHRATSVRLGNMVGAVTGAGSGGGAGSAGTSSNVGNGMRLVLGIRIPAGRAGQVFGAPLNVAADRTSLIALSQQQGRIIDLKNKHHQIQEQDSVPGLPEKSTLDEEGIERRAEACTYLPAIAIRCLDYLNEYGKTEEGLYRIPGSTQQIQNLRTIFDAGADVDLLSKLSTRDLEPSAVASCFKLWLRELPESLLHNMEREIDILLLEHTGNAASSKVTMAQSQSPSASPTNPSGLAEQAAGGPPASQSQSQLGGPHQLPMQQQPQPTIISHQMAKGSIVPASPLVISRIKDLFANELPKENVILLREIAYHLAHLASFSNVTKMTLANLRLILSPTLRLSPVMLALLVNEREQVFPKPGQLSSEADDQSNIIHFNTRPLDLSLPLSLSNGNSSQPHLTLSLPGNDSLPPMLPSKSPAPTVTPASMHGSASGTTSIRTPYSSTESNWTTSTTSYSSGASNAGRRSNGSIPGYRASWHVVDLPSMVGGNGSPSSQHHRDSLEGESEALFAGTPIARKFLHQRNASASNLLEKATVASAVANVNAVGSASPASSVHSKRSLSSSGGANGSNILTRTPTLSGRSPSPFFSSGAPPAGLGFMASHSRKRSSASSFSSIVSNSLGSDGRPLWRSRKASASTSQQQQQDSPQQSRGSGPTPQQKDQLQHHHNHQDEEEELSNSSDTNTSICSSASSAQTPKDQHDIDQVLTNAGSAESTPARRSTDSTDAAILDSRRATITAENFTASFARLGQGKNANSDEMKRKRGSMMIMNMPDFANMKTDSSK